VDKRSFFSLCLRRPSVRLRLEPLLLAPLPLPAAAGDGVPVMPALLPFFNAFWDSVAAMESVALTLVVHFWVKGRVVTASLALPPFHPNHPRWQRLLFRSGSAPLCVTDQRFFIDVSHSEEWAAHLGWRCGLALSEENSLVLGLVAKPIPTKQYDVLIADLEGTDDRVNGQNIDIPQSPPQ